MVRFASSGVVAIRLLRVFSPSVRRGSVAQNQPGVPPSRVAAQSRSKWPEKWLQIAICKSARRNSEFASSNRRGEDEMANRKLRRSALALSLAALMILGACATDEDPVLEGTPPGEEEEEAEAPTIQVTGTDFAFSGIPATIEAGTTIEFTNASAVEAHEIVAFRLPDTETRGVEELLQLPEGELDAIVGGPPATVIVAAPNSEGMAVAGDGSLTEPGRYAFVCFIPTGVDPDEFMAAAQESEDGPPSFPDAGPPHFVNGMFAEATVE